MRCMAYLPDLGYSMWLDSSHDIMLIQGGSGPALSCVWMQCGKIQLGSLVCLLQRGTETAGTSFAHIHHHAEPPFPFHPQKTPDPSRKKTNNKTEPGGQKTVCPMQNQPHEGSHYHGRYT